MEQVALFIIGIASVTSVAFAIAAYKLRQSNKQRRVNHQGHTPA
jgi:hypothetical protein